MQSENKVCASPCQAIRQLLLALRTELFPIAMLRCERKTVLWKQSVLQLWVKWRLSSCCAVCLSTMVYQCEERQINNLLKEISLPFSTSIIKCVTKRCWVNCLADIWVLHILVWILAPQTQSGFPKLLPAVLFASGLDGSLGLQIAKIRSDAPIFVFNNRDKLCPL